MQLGDFSTKLAKKIYLNHARANQPATLAIECGSRLLQQRVSRVPGAATELHVFRHNARPGQIPVLAGSHEDGLLYGAGVEAELRRRSSSKVLVQLTVTIISVDRKITFFRVANLCKLNVFDHSLQPLPSVA